MGSFFPPPPVVLPLDPRKPHLAPTPPPGETYSDHSGPKKSSKNGGHSSDLQKNSPAGYPRRHMARPSAILERFWLHNDPQNRAKKLYNSDLGEIVIFATSPMRNQRFHWPGPLQKWCTISFFNKKDSATRPPPKIFNFQPQGASGWQHEPKSNTILTSVKL